MMITETYKNELQDFEKKRPTYMLFHSGFLFIISSVFALNLYLLTHADREDIWPLFGLSIFLGHVVLAFGFYLGSKGVSYEKEWFEKIIRHCFPNCTWEEIREGKKRLRLLCYRVPGEKVWDKHGFWKRPEYEIQFKGILLAVFFGILPLGLWGISYLSEDIRSDFTPIFLWSLLVCAAIMILFPLMSSRMHNSKLQRDPEYRPIPRLFQHGIIGGLRIHSIIQDDSGVLIKLYTKYQLLPSHYKSYTDERSFSSWHELQKSLEKLKIEFGSLRL